ncbi:MAG TPA: GDSL-type esterase/lipase family protein, partial [Candidatus Acidoferrum sp.]|nr:GDSL-type esterase/lipase family protein [Candidatus Acidoferrum sp.]
RQHVLNLNGANWIRMHVTAVNGSSGNMDASFNLDIHNASQGTNDTWLILGDSITQDDMGHYEPSNFMQQVNAAHPTYFPSQINGGIGGWDSGSPLKTDPSTGQVYIDEFLASFPGHYVSLDYGTNDANEGNQATAIYTTNMTTMINKVIAAGKVPVLRRSIPWGCTANIQSFGPTINGDLANLLAQYPQAVAGPDEWAYFQANQSLISGDCIHPTIGTGNAAYRQVYLNALLADIYQNAP